MKLNIINTITLLLVAGITITSTEYLTTRAQELDGDISQTETDSSKDQVIQEEQIPELSQTLNECEDDITPSQGEAAEGAVEITPSSVEEFEEVDENELVKKEVLEEHTKDIKVILTNGESDKNQIHELESINEGSRVSTEEIATPDCKYLEDEEIKKDIPNSNSDEVGEVVLDEPVISKTLTVEELDEPDREQDCTHGNFLNYPMFRNTGECLQFVRGELVSPHM